MNRRFAAALAALSLAISVGCATRGIPRFPPAGPVESSHALEAWTEALRRADSLPDAKLLYEATASSGLLRVSGTLAVSQAPGRVDAVLTGPFGAPIARYEDGALRGDRIRPIAVAPEELRAILAGVWRGGAPFVAGVRDGAALLRWAPPGGQVQAILDLRTRRLAQLQVDRREGRLTARYSGESDPWPEKIELEEGRSGNKLRLTLVGRERS